MVRKEVKRRTSLLMGIALAIVVGAAAAFLIFALPQHLLEKLTTVSGLSHVMVQAEPPISQNDRSLLAALAGIGTAGLGWVMIDWLLFRRVGMSAIIRQREDDYEDDEDGYRPSDPLDLVKHVPQTIMEGGALANPNDPRRPLSARTDIGDPPKPGAAAWPPVPNPYDIAFDQRLPPIDRLLPEVERPVAGGPVQQPAPAVIPDPLGLSLPAFPADGFSPPPPVFPSAGAGGPQPPVGVQQRSAYPLADLPDWVPPPQPAMQPEPAPLIAQSVPISAPPPVAPITAPPLPGAPVPSEPPAQTQFPPQPVAVTPPPQPSPPAAMSATELDHAPLGDLLARLEQGMRRRRPTTPPPVREIQTHLAALEAPQREQPILPAGVAAPPPPSSLVAPIAPRPVQPPAAYAAPPVYQMEPEPIPQWTSRDSPPEAVNMASSPAVPAALANGDGLLDQPLHVALDVLRNLVRR